jgi:sec-independent protein translocase protein TatB
VRVFGLGFQEMVVIAVLVLMFFPADDLPELMRTAGRWYARMRRASDELRRAFNAEVARAESEYRLEELRTRREAAARARQDAAAVEDGAPALAGVGAEAAGPFAPASGAGAVPSSPTDPRLRGGVPLDQRDEDDGNLPLDAAPRALPADAAPRARGVAPVSTSAAPAAPAATEAPSAPREP